MPELPVLEKIIFLFIVLTYLAVATIGFFQLTSSNRKYGTLLYVFICLGVLLNIVLLTVRAIAIGSIPLTEIFDSMIFLTIVFGLIYIFLGTMIRQVLFGAVIGWLMLFLVLMAGAVASPASKLRTAAATPWAMAHGIAMVLAGASIVFAATVAFLYLLGKRRLKQKKIAKVLGKVPNIEKLKQMNAQSLKVCFLLLTFGLVSGVGMVLINSPVFDKSIFGWFIDSKIILISTSWLLLAVFLVLKKLGTVKDKIAAYIAILIFVLMLFAFVGTAVFCQSKHDFTKKEIPSIKLEGELQQ